MLPTRAQWEPTGHPTFTRALTGSLSLVGAMTPVRNRLLYSGLDFQNLLSDWAPRATTGWTMLAATLHYPSNFRGGPVDAGFEQTSSTDADLITPATQLNISPKVNIGVSELARVRAFYKDSASVGEPFELVVLVYNSSDVLLGWWTTFWGNHGVEFEQAFVNQVDLFATQAKVAVGWRSRVNGVKVTAKAFSISKESSITLKVKALVNMTGQVTFTTTHAGAKRAVQTLTGVVSFGGNLAKETRRALTAQVSFSGSLLKTAGKVLTGQVSFTGVLNRFTSKFFTAQATFSGALTRVKMSVLALVGQVSFSSVFSKMTNKPLAGNVTFSTALVKRTARNFVGNISFTSVFSKLSAKSLTGQVTFAASLVKMTAKNLLSQVSFVGALLKRTGKELVSQVSFTVAFVASQQQARFLSLFAQVSFQGSITKATARSFTSSLGFQGLLTKITGKNLLGGVSFSGLFRRSPLKSLTANLTFVTAFRRDFPKVLAGGVSFLTRLNFRRNLNFTGAVSFSGSLQSVFAWLQVQASVAASILTMFHWPWRSIFARHEEPVVLSIGHQETALRHSQNYNVTITVKGPIEMAYKRGTNILFNAAFTDKNGASFDPDTGTAKMYVKNASTGLYLTGYDRATGGKTMTRLSVGQFEADWQSLLTDAVGRYEVEMEGFIGTKRFLDSVFVQLKA